MRLLIVHPGIQHSYRLANASVASGLFEEVHLLTSVLYHESEQPLLKSFQKRVKPIHPEVRIHRHLVYELLSRLSRNLYNKIIINPNKQVHNNPIYFWQFIFGCLCLPFIWLHRKNSQLVCFETAGWPITWFAKKWGIPVVMDFASISHETAESLGIHETTLGKAIKLRERQHIDFAFFCSDFCRRSFEGRTSSRKDFVLYLGAGASTPLSLTIASTLPMKNRDKLLSLTKYEMSSEKGVEGGKWKVESGEWEVNSQKSIVERGEVDEQGISLESEVLNPESEVVGEVSEVRSQRSGVGGEEAGKEEVMSFKSETLTNKSLNPHQLKIKISFIANLEYRKGLDILLEALYAYAYPVFLEVHLIGKIRPSWVQAHLPEKMVNQQVQLVYQEAMSQQALFAYLAEQQFDLNVQPSRFDSFAMVVPETMMLGIPNLVSPYVGAGEMLDHGINGWIMNNLDAEELSLNLRQLMQMDVAERRKFKTAVLAKATQMTWENYDQAVTQVMNEILTLIK